MFEPGLNATEIVRICCVGAMLLFTPGALIQALLLGKPKLGLLERIPIAFVFSVGTIALIGACVYALSGTLEMVRTIFLVFLAVALLVWLWIFKPLKRISGFSLRSCQLGWPQIVLVVFVVLCGIAALLGGAWLSHTADSFYHLAAIHRQLQTNEVFPRGVFYDYQPTRLNHSVGSWHLVLALFSQLADIEITWLWYHLSVIIAPLLALAYYGFGLHLTGDARIALFGTILQFVFYEKLDFRASVYPNQAGFVLLWVTLTITLLYLQHGSLTLLLLVFIASAVMASWHLLMPELFFALLITYLATRIIVLVPLSNLPHDSEVRRLFKLLVPFVLLTAPIVLYRVLKSNLVNMQNVLSPSEEPTFKWILNLPGGLAIVHPANLYAVDPRWRFAPFRFLSWLSAYLTIPFLMFAGIRQKKGALVLFSSLIIVPVVVFNPLVISIGQGLIPERAITRLVLLPPYGLVLAWFLIEQFSALYKRLFAMPPLKLWTNVQAWRSLFVIVTCSATLILATYLIVREGIDNLIDLYHPASKHVYSIAAAKHAERLPSDPEYVFIVENSSPRDVIASDPISSYYLGGLTGRPVISVPRGHYPPLGDPPHWVRREESVDILDWSVDITETIRLLDSYNARFIWIDSRIVGRNPNASSRSLDPEAFRRKFLKYPELFERIYQDQNVSIFRYDKKDS